MKDNQSRPDNPRRVFSVPCQLQVECTLFVLATDLTHARHAVSLVDLQHFLTFDSESVTTDGSLLRVEDVVTFPVDVSVVDITPLPTNAYPPNTHPDFMGEPRR